MSGFDDASAAIPLLIAAVGVFVALLPRPRSVVSLGSAAIDLAVAAALAYPPCYAIPWGELHCVAD
jgi:hypothetical protein